MDKKLLLGLLRFEKYFKVNVGYADTDGIGYTNIDFERLLNYIGGNHRDRIRYLKKHPGRQNDGIAYILIRRKTDRLLGVWRWPVGKLGTSKREVSTIRRFYERRKHQQVLIPYKISYIFRAIIELLHEIWSDDKAPDIPPALFHCIGLTYRAAFYEDHIKAYYKAYNRTGEISLGDTVKRELKNDFDAFDTPFREVFKRGNTNV